MMDQADRGRGLVDLLAARTGAVDLHLNVLGRMSTSTSSRDFGHDLQRAKGGLPAALASKGRPAPAGAPRSRSSGGRMRFALNHNGWRS